MQLTDANFENCFGKNNTASKIDAIISDNRQYIIEYGTVADYLLYDLVEGDNQEYSWMKDECAIMYEKLDSASKAMITDLLFDFIRENYDYTLND